MRRTKLTCNCRDEVDTKVDNGELRQALSRSSTITSQAQDSLVQQACDRRALRSRFVDNGEVRQALNHASWSSNHVDFLLYRSQHEHDDE